MAYCYICGVRTQLYEAGKPICLECDCKQEAERRKFSWERIQLQLERATGSDDCKILRCSN
jgi:hypothetical protein